MGADWTLEALAVGGRVHEGVVVGEGGIVAIGAFDQWRAARPAADTFRGNADRLIAVDRTRGRLAVFLHCSPESFDVLFELPNHEVGAVASEVALGPVRGKLRQMRASVERWRHHGGDG